MQDIYNPENFTPYLYHAPENSGTGLPFIIRASRMGCGYEESFVYKEMPTIPISPFISCSTAAASSISPEKIIC